MGVVGPMARSVPDLALLLGVQAGYDPRDPLSLDGDLALGSLDFARDFTGTRIAWCGDMNGELPCEPGVLETCRAALRSFEEMGCTVDTANPDAALEPVWRAWLVLRAWQVGNGLKGVYDNPALRPHMKPEAIFEVENGARLSGRDVSAASLVRSQWYEAVRRFFERYDYWILPTAQVFPFDAALDWPREIAGRPMETYHAWMKVALLVTLSGCPVLAAPAGFGPQGLPIGLQIVGPNRAERALLELAHAYDERTGWVAKCPPPLR
jgi:amidase